MKISKKHSCIILWRFSKKIWNKMYRLLPLEQLWKIFEIFFRTGFRTEIYIQWKLVETILERFWEWFKESTTETLNWIWFKWFPGGFRECFSAKYYVRENIPEMFQKHFQNMYCKSIYEIFLRKLPECLKKGFFERFQNKIDLTMKCFENDSKLIN